MARCRCSQDQCPCVLEAGDNVTITGSGADTDPYVITADPVSTGTIGVQGTETVDLTMAGTGTTASPYVLSAQAHIEDLLTTLDTGSVDLHLTGTGSVADKFVLSADVAGFGDMSDADPGDVLTMGPDGDWIPAPPVTAPPGAITVGRGLVGDGSVASPLMVYIPDYAAARALSVAP